MGRKSKQTVRIEIENPEDLEKAEEKFTEYIYKKYKEALAEGRIKPHQKR